MKKFVETTFGALAGIGFLCAAIAIFVWDVGKLQQARDSRDWPRVEGRVTRSTVDHSQRESKPQVVYAYTVAGTPYTSGQISFDLFDKPGGQGRIESIIARYPVGEKVTVYYDPNEPRTAILEPEVYSPFFMPLLFGALFFFGGSLTLWRTFRQVMDGRPVPQQGTTTKRRILATAAMSVLIYAILVLVSLDSAVRDTFVKAFGERPAGIPNLLGCSGTGCS